MGVVEIVMGVEDLSFISLVICMFDHTGICMFHASFI